MFFVVFFLNGAAALRLAYRVFHRRRDKIGIHNDLAMCISRSTANGLDEAASAAQEALFICVQNCDERHLRDIKALSQQVDADKHVKLAETQVTDDFHAFHRIDVVVHVAHADAVIFKEAREVFRHFFRERCHENTLAARGTHVDLRNKIVNLPVGRLYRDARV